jgi:hypothetical protein
MADTLDHLLGHDESMDTPEQSKRPRVILALANHAQTVGWGRAKALQHEGGSWPRPEDEVRLLRRR